VLIGTLHFLRRHRVDWRQPSGDCANLKPASTTAMLVGERPREATRGIGASYATRALSRLSDLRTGDSVSLFFFAYVRKQTRFTRVASSYVHKWNLPSRLFSFISQCDCVWIAGWTFSARISGASRRSSDIASRLSCFVHRIPVRRTWHGTRLRVEDQRSYGATGLLIELSLSSSRWVND